MDRLSVIDTMDMAQLAQSHAWLRAQGQPEIPEQPATLVGHACPSLAGACLVAEYTAYIASAGYSTSPSATAERSLGAWSFLSRFPQPEVFLSLPVADQMRLPSRERNFVHYLFLRHILPMPAAYALMARAHLGDMSRRLMEPETYQRYQGAALRLGYTEPTIRRQFQSLLCLMAWAQKPLDALSAEDVDAFTQAMRAVYQETEGDGDMRVLLENGLPRASSQELSGLRKVLSQLRVLSPTPRHRGKREKPAQSTPYQKVRALQQDTTSPQACLVAQYISYTAAAGYSTTPSALMERSLGTWSFLSRFPQPEAWLDLPLDKQVRLRSRERQFLHYLFLRHLLPMPSAYILVAGHDLASLARPLMERETYQRYREVARRLGYTEPTIQRQFEALLCLMAWAQKPMAGLTAADMEAFTQALIAARQELENRGGVLSPQDVPLGERLPQTVLKATQDGLPVHWSGRLETIRHVLYRLGILPHPEAQRRRPPFSQRWQGMPPGISATAQRYLGQLAVSLRPTSLVKEEARLRRFFAWLAQDMPEITQVSLIQRCHIEAFKE